MFQIQSKSESVTYKTCSTLLDCKRWFQNLCNIPDNWKVVTPTGEVLDGRYYQSWEEEPEYVLQFCENCFQMKNHLNGVCQKCKQ